MGHDNVARPFNNEGDILQGAQTGDVLTLPTLAVISPSRPESVKTDSLPWNAPWPKQGRSELSLYKGWLG
jgi:hypothetical protein